MIFFDDNEYDNKKTFENKYGKLSKTQDIIQELETKINNNNNKEKKTKEESNKIISKKRKRHDSSDEEEEKESNNLKKNKQLKEDKEEFINKINNVNDLIEEKEEQDELKNKNEKEVKDTWKKDFVDIGELNKDNNKIEIKENSKLLDDPMKNLLSKNKFIEESDELIKKRGFFLPRCKFPPLINRFNIKPGYRWDGFNRSNGFENKILNIKYNINN